ncbi:sulfatase-like hydrolase/transferase [Aestuariibaculum suncheonense]|uniref:Sulfatase-like hydrolase/transferase n=1 Tax=Aestuariibaculum suncheonense TaxID=1028745 RepID=A0A8J6QP53_9FLAO|nr:sulfatase-like hydrolase/transferase [Aestuariibaculum suncheonense]MBD0834174.1 sulfatase-like hydrolase/transferase [Aestuariibaculum suncheonense]
MSIRFLPSTSLYFLFLLFAACKNTSNQKEAVKKANQGLNVLVIIADDAGWNDVGYNGSEISTPNINSLANNGVKLNRFYANPTCSPSRVSLLTGMPSSRIGVVAPISGKSNKTLPDSITTLPQALKKKNYQNALFGKWHLGLDIYNGPNAFGFDYSYGFLHGQIDQYTHRYKNGDASWYRNDKMIEEEGHTTDLVTKEAIEWLTKKRDTAKNFYVQLAYSAPHFPLQEEEKWKKQYYKTIKDSSRVDFAAAMTHMDHAIGKVLKTLKEQHLDENTLVLFISDNGAMENWYPTYQYDGKFKANQVLGSNFPLRDWKTSNYEGAIRVPAIVYWKGKLQPEENSNYMAISDVMPTILSLIGEDIPKNVEGVNVWSSIENSKVETNHDIYVRGHIQESLIHKPWKIIRNRHKDGSPALYQLYNIENDPEEKHNMIDEQPKVAEKIKELLQNQFEKDDKTVNVELK